MKTTVFFIAFVLLTAGAALGLVSHTANQITVAWDAVTVEEGTVEYDVYLANAITDPDKAAPVKIETTTGLTSLITLGVEGRYFVGVRSARIIDGERVAESEQIAWSDAAEFAPEPFLVQFFAAPENVTGIRIQ